MKKRTDLNWQKQLFAALACVAVLLVAIRPVRAQDQWDKGDEWRAKYKVGDPVQFSVSDRASDFQTCKVSTNEPGGVMRVDCDAFKQWVAGSYIVYGKSSIRSTVDAETKTDTKKESAANTNSKPGNKRTSAQKKWASGDEWRGQSEVGDKIQFSISGRSADFQTCTVAENDSASVMRVKCDAFKQWDAGTYIVHAKYYVRTKTDGPNRKEPEPAFNEDKPNKGNPNKQAPAGLKVGEYACYGVGGRIMIGLGFKVLPGNRYNDLEGKNSGTFSVVGDTVRFRGGHLGGQTGRDLRGNSFTIGKQGECEPY